MFFCITPDGNGCGRDVRTGHLHLAVMSSGFIRWDSHYKCIGYIGTYIGTIIGTVTSGAKMGGGEHGVDVYGL